MKKSIFSKETLLELRSLIKGEVFADEYTRLIYSTDASAYRQLPQLVVQPSHTDDLKELILFATRHKTSLIPRAAGTSLAGQVVGGGIIVDISKHLNKILEINTEEHWVRVQPGVVLDELNKILESTGLFFAPETSTSNRCMIGGMVGNNSCGSHSLVYGSTRDHTLEIKAFLSDGTESVFTNISLLEFDQKCDLYTLEGSIYRNIKNILGDKFNQEEIRSQFPDKSIHRRNTGYAIDLLLESEPFANSNEEFNFCKLIAGSEGTLCIITEIKLNLEPLPPKEKALICVHCNTLDEAFEGNIVALKHNPVAIELMDSVILEQTKANISQRKNRFFLQGDPAAVLIIELAEKTRAEIDSKAEAVINDLRNAGYGYHFPIVYNEDVSKVWSLRKAGLGVLSNLPGDAKPVAVIEDTAVNPEVLPAYMKDFRQMLAVLNLECVYYAHIATGELHLRPVLNLKDPKDVELFHTVAFETAKLVKKYRGSLSGEHGDGRLRGEFIPMMIGEKNYKLLESIKDTWDPEGILNPGKITRTPKMNSSLRYNSGIAVSEPDTIFDFSGTRGILRAAEQCNGSADCRKSAVMGGTMCPSYMVTKDENATTRARANILREFLTNSDKKNKFDHKEIYKVMDLCISCKGCKSECPSNVDMAKYKAEFLQHWHDANGVPFRTRIIANISKLNKLGMVLPSVFNFLVTNALTSWFMKRTLGFAPKRTIPTLYKMTLRAWVKMQPTSDNNEIKGKVFLFADEFTDYNDVEIGIKAVKLLNKLGYKVEVPDHVESGRAYLSKGLVRIAQKLARLNIAKLHPIINELTPLVGIEPSAILSFRDEYPDLAGAELKPIALNLAKHCLMFDEFIMREVKKGNISQSQFNDKKQHIRLHGHCHQKSLASTGPTKDMLSLPVNYSVDEIKSGCCGMAGSFGYEKEHYDISVNIGELILMPEVRKTSEHTIISAPGTSCRQQIKDGTGRISLHPIEVLYNALLA